MKRLYGSDDKNTLYLLEHKSERMKKEYSALLKKEEYSPRKKMVKAIDKLVKVRGIKKDKQLLKELKMLLGGELSNSSSDSDIINYRDWLKIKIN